MKIKLLLLKNVRLIYNINKSYLIRSKKLMNSKTRIKIQRKPLESQIQNQRIKFIKKPSKSQKQTLHLNQINIQKIIYNKKFQRNQKINSFFNIKNQMKI